MSVAQHSNSGACCVRVCAKLQTQFRSAQRTAMLNNRFARRVTAFRFVLKRLRRLACSVREIDLVKPSRFCVFMVPFGLGMRFRGTFWCSFLGRRFGPPRGGFSSSARPGWCTTRTLMVRGMLWQVLGLFWCVYVPLGVHIHPTVTLSDFLHKRRVLIYWKYFFFTRIVCQFAY